MQEQTNICYEIRVLGAVDAQWSDWFTGLVIEPGPQEAGQPTTLLRLTALDPASLHGVLSMISNLNITLLSVTRVEQKG